jgi:hypothetical protein
MTTGFYQTNRLPKDKFGCEIKPLDLVILGDIPEHEWSDPEFASRKHYAGCYGLVTYANRDSVAYQPFFYGKKDHPGWVSGDGQFVNVLTRRIADGKVVSTNFWMPLNSLKKIPFNSFIMDIFADYPWEMMEEEGPSSFHFIRKGMLEYEHIEKVVKTPYEVLVDAHEAAVSVLNGAQSA